MAAATALCSPGENAHYRARDPRTSPLYRLFEEHFDEFERVYPERYQARYGFWRPVIGKAVKAYLECGRLQEGFARVRCPDCGEEFLAQITQHIPPKGAQLIRYYGWYSNKSRGLRTAAANTVTARTTPGGANGALNATGDSAPPSRGVSRMRWAALIQRVYGADPLRCPRCGGTMEMISILTHRAQPAAVRRILEHCGLWCEPRARPPPHSTERTQKGQSPVQEGGLYYIPVDEFLASL